MNADKRRLHITCLDLSSYFLDTTLAHIQAYAEDLIQSGIPRFEEIGRAHV